MSSSPLPSPSTLQHKPLKTQPGSRKAPIPLDAPTGFLSAMSLVTKEQLQQPLPSREHSETPVSEQLISQHQPESGHTATNGKLKKPSKKPAIEQSADQSLEHGLGVSAPPKKARKTAAGNNTEGEGQSSEVAPKRGRKKVAATENSQDALAPAPAKRGRKKAVVDPATTLSDGAPSEAIKSLVIAENTELSHAAPILGSSDTVKDAQIQQPPKQPRKRAVKAKPVTDGPEVVDTNLVPEVKKAVKPRARKTTKATPLAEVENNQIHALIPDIPRENEKTTAEQQHKALEAAGPAIKPAKDSSVKPSEDHESNSRFFGKDRRRVDLPRVIDGTLHQDNNNEPADEHNTVNLDLAPRRRMNWTPPPLTDAPSSFQRLAPREVDDDTRPDDVSVDVGIADSIPACNATEDAATKDDTIMVEQPLNSFNFANLMGEFGYQQDNMDGPSVNQPGQPEPADIPTEEKKKRGPKKKAEHKKKGEPKKNAEPKKKAESKKKAEPKPKAPRKPAKKPTTITGLATAAYRPQLQPEGEGSDSVKLTSYFSVEGVEAGQTPAQAELEPPKTAKRKSTGAKPTAKQIKKAEEAALAAIRYKLESPETARRNMTAQDFLFGTSSQLAAAESPDEFRDIQRAIKESEEYVGSQDMENSQAVEAMRAVSRMRVPSAPHGTDLSVGQAHRDLWLSAARDRENGTFEGDERLGVVIEEEEAAIVSEMSANLLDSLPPPAPVLQAPTTEDIVELDHLSPGTKSVQEEEAHDSGYMDIDDVSDMASVDKSSTTHVGHHVEPILIASSAQSVLVRNLSPTPQPEEPPVPSRVILKTLNPNASISTHVTDLHGKASSPVKPVVPSTNTEMAPAIAGLDSSIKRPRGRPRKVVTDVKTSPKPRGRPPKSATTAPDPASRSPKRPRLNQPAFTQPPPDSSPYLDIDDISDAEIASAPPSPPKRRSKSPIVQNVLELSNPAAVPPIKGRSEKQLQADFATISISLFPKITQTVKTQPPTTDMTKPSWNEKMLLYDPIVLEDLTAWLNRQGVYISSERVKAVKKGKKRKKGDEEKLEEEVVPEMEIVHEEIRPWMVQKWCEEHSVCCLWREGLRGGVKARY